LTWKPLVAAPEGVRSTCTIDTILAPPPLADWIAACSAAVRLATVTALAATVPWKLPSALAGMVMLKLPEPVPLFSVTGADVLVRVAEAVARLALIWVVLPRVIATG